MTKGRIIKGVGGFYDVNVDNQVFFCRARGLFRKHQTKPMVGDWVEIEPLDNHEGYILSIYDRNNALLRPEVANVDLAVIMFSIKSPNINLLLLDKLTIMAEKYNMEAIIVLNKSDLVCQDEIKAIAEIYRKAGYVVYEACKDDADAICAIKNHMKGKTSVLAGPSGVGKSTMMNCIHPHLFFETSDISKKTKRGKHTTRHSELVEIEKGTFVIDTPGFSSLELELLDIENLKHCFKEFEAYESNCKFRSCNHIQEPQCGVKQAVSKGDIPPSRYENYCYLQQEYLKGRK